jgi:predicted  nucleic acid-binding Zn-ribbon protein
MNEDLKQANEAVAKVTQNRDAFRGELEKLQKRNAGATVALDGCNAQLKEAQAKLEAATKTTARRR